MSAFDSLSDPNKGLPAWYALVLETHDNFPMYEHLARQGFPTVQQLRRGIVLGCIAHSFWLAVWEPVFEQFWDGDTYLDDQMQGERWAAAFSEGGAVAVFYSSESSRNPYPEGSPPYDQSRYFQGMPEHLQPVKESVLSWMLDLDFRPGRPQRGGDCGHVGGRLPLHGGGVLGRGLPPQPLGVLSATTAARDRPRGVVGRHGVARRRYRGGAIALPTPDRLDRPRHQRRAVGMARIPRSGRKRARL